MTLARKGSRTVDVDGTRYRWMGGRSSKGQYSIDPVLTLVAHVDKEPADSTLELKVYESHCDALTPEIVATFIRNAKHRGWNPASKGKFTIEPNVALNMFNNPDEMCRREMMF
jgi:hypothetical protein